jgi:hypothetical protein
MAAGPYGMNMPPAQIKLPKDGYLRVDGHQQRFETVTDAKKWRDKNAAGVKIHVYSAWHKRVGEAP